MLIEWYGRVDSAQRAHYVSAERFRRRSFWLGIPTVILSLVVGSSVFAALKLQPGPRLQMLVGFLSLSAAVLAGLQTFLGYPERSERHRVAAAKYGALGREMEMYLATGAIANSTEIKGLKTRIDALAIDSPVNTREVYERGRYQSRESELIKKLTSVPGEN